MKKYAYNTNDNLLILKENEIYNGLVHKEREKIEKLDENVDTSSLEFKFKGKTADEDFGDYDNALVLINKIKFGATSLSQAKKEQKELKR